MTDFLPLQLLLATFAGWANRHQAQVVDYLIEENRVLEEQLGKKRLRLTNDQREDRRSKLQIRRLPQQDPRHRRQSRPFGDPGVIFCADQLVIVQI